ncbi:hypothetical protein [Nocardia rhamnosiphila]|uniref:Peptidylprolyl isomerase n=1 Tax=Nocardia rhamnosiphila TaxID=426716 RepID=A0ABV2X152_9NOCA
MAGSHAERADELAAQANRALEEALELAGKPPQNAFAAIGDQHVADVARWAKVRALQAQAQIHATLALNDSVARNGGDLGR